MYSQCNAQINQLVLELSTAINISAFIVALMKEGENIWIFVILNVFLLNKNLFSRVASVRLFVHNSILQKNGLKKSRVRETKNLSTDAESSNDTNKILLVGKIHPVILHPLWAKVFKSATIFFHYFSPRIPKNLKSLDIGLWKMGAKRCFNKVNKWINNFLLLPLWAKFSNLIPLLSMTVP